MNPPRLDTACDVGMSRAVVGKTGERKINDPGIKERLGTNTDEARFIDTGDDEDASLITA